MTSMSKITTFFNDNAETLAVEIVESVLRSMKLVIPEVEKEQAIKMYIEFFGFLGKSLMENNDGVPEDLIVWSKKNAEQQISSGGKISEIVVRYPPTRSIFTELLTRISVEFGLSIKENAFMIKKVNEMLDLSLNETIFTFEYLANSYREKAQREIAELSAPIVLIKEGIAVLPLIGMIDCYRATYILEKVVPEIANLQIQYLIADYSGILTIDAEIAKYLRQIGDILLLLGINVMITGLRPELALTIVNSRIDRIDMSAIKTFANVKQALEYIE
jgi:rsbT co-antagonist protein RsbR